MSVQRVGFTTRTVLIVFNYVLWRSVLCLCNQLTRPTCLIIEAAQIYFRNPIDSPGSWCPEDLNQHDLNLNILRGLAID